MYFSVWETVKVIVQARVHAELEKFVEKIPIIELKIFSTFIMTENKNREATIKTSSILIRDKVSLDLRNRLIFRCTQTDTYEPQNSKITAGKTSQFVKNWMPFNLVIFPQIELVVL